MFYYARCLKEIFDLMYRDTGKKNSLGWNFQLESDPNMNKKWESLNIDSHIF